jgi:hypothetical protein
LTIFADELSNSGVSALLGNTSGLLASLLGSFGTLPGGL